MAEWGRFLNADGLLIAGDPLTAANMYAYCNGNPVMLVDPSGMASFSWLKNIANNVANFFKNLFAPKLPVVNLPPTTPPSVVSPPPTTPPSVVSPSPTTPPEYVSPVIDWNRIPIISWIINLWNSIFGSKTIGALSVWRATVDNSSNYIGRWGTSATNVPRIIWVRDLGSNATIVQAIREAVAVWNTALSLSGNNAMTVSTFTGFPLSTYKIYFIVGDENQLVSNRATLLPGLTERQLRGQDRDPIRPYAGGVYQVSNAEGTWTHSTGNKNGRRMTRPYGYIREHTGRTASQYKNVAIHELAHALGWFGHSNNSADIMYWDNPLTLTQLSNAEVNHLRQLYGLTLR